MLRKIQAFIPFLLSLTGGILLYFSWHPNGFFALIFIALIPFFFMIKSVNHSSIAVFNYSFIGFFVFHLLAAWWMYSSTIVGSLIGQTFNSVYMAMVLYIWSIGTKRLKNPLLHIISLLSFWIGFEFVHQYWDLAWPWFTLGHAFADKTSWIQWYRFTGALGGSAWILIVNWLFYCLITSIQERKHKLIILYFPVTAILISLPIFISKNVKQDLNIVSNKLEVLIVQPNINPNKEKFNGLSQSEQLDQALGLIKEHWDDKLDLVVFPETMVIEPIYESEIRINVWINYLKQKLPSDVGVFLGAFTYQKADEAPFDQQAVINDSINYVLFNSAILLKNEEVQIYHKHHLVPLVEKQPFQFVMRPFQNFIEQSGGFFGSYGTFNTQTQFKFRDSLYISPLICFESAFNFNSTAAKYNSALTVLITNDGWWSSKSGYLQHLALARLRAIESGKWIVRCANTGVSAIIDNNGNIQRKTNYNEPATLKYSVPLIHQATFYMKHGDFIGKTSLILSCLFLLVMFFKRKNKLY